MFTKKLSLATMNVLVNTCETAAPIRQRALLEEVFSELSWKHRVGGGRKPEQNETYLRFSRLLALGGYVDAARMLIPENHGSFLGDYKSDQCFCRLREGGYTTENDLHFDLDSKGAGSTLAYAITAAALRAHYRLQRNKAKSEAGDIDEVPAELEV